MSNPKQLITPAVVLVGTFGMVRYFGVEAHAALLFSALMALYAWLARVTAVAVAKYCMERHLGCVGLALVATVVAITGFVIPGIIVDAMAQSTQPFAPIAGYVRALALFMVVAIVGVRPLVNMILPDEQPHK